MRATFTVVHRWAGLFIAVFLFIAGATGAVISWDHELDEWLNAHLFDAKATGKPLSPHDLVSRAEAADPRIRVSYFPLSFEEGHNASLFVEPRVDPKTGELYNVEYNQVFIDPVSGDVAGKRFWGAISLDRENILPFLYKLHYSMHIPDFWGIDRWGMWFMGIVGIVCCSIVSLDSISPCLGGRDRSDPRSRNNRASSRMEPGGAGGSAGSRPGRSSGAPVPIAAISICTAPSASGFGRRF